MNRKLKKIIVAKSLKAARGMLGGDLQEGSCLYLAGAVCAFAKEHGVTLKLYAGTAYWPCVARAEDDGVSPNAFGYQWDPNSPETIVRVASNLMPEMHVWAGDPINREWVDISTGYWPAQCLKLQGRPWTAPRPPKFYWGSADILPAGVVYEPSISAGSLAVRLLKSSFGLEV